MGYFFKNKDIFLPVVALPTTLQKDEGTEDITGKAELAFVLISPFEAVFL